MAAAATALAHSISTSSKVSKAIKRLQDTRNQRSHNLNDTAVLDHDVRAQIDEVFLVLALLGEALLPLGIFDNAYYPQTLDDAQTAFASGAHDLMPVAFGELDAELQYVCTAGLAFCSVFAPMPVYRGFGAAVLGDWDWACPDLEYLDRKAKAKAGSFLGMPLGKREDLQPNRQILLAFDQVAQMLQVKQVAFLRNRPTVSGFAEQQPRYSSRRPRDVKDEIEWLEDWTKKAEKVGHPSPRGTVISSWACPFATWSSPYSCEMQSSRGAWEMIMTNQLDPGRLLHAFVCRNNLDVSDGHILVLLPRSPAEALACWLEGLPSTNHRVVKWADLDKELFEKKCSKSMRKQLGQYPLPSYFVIHDFKASQRPALVSLTSAPSVIGPNATPPPYSLPLTRTQLTAYPRNRSRANIAELGERDPVELDTSTVPSKSPQPHHASTMALLSSHDHSQVISAGTADLRLLTALREKPNAQNNCLNPSVASIGLSSDSATAVTDIQPSTGEKTNQSPTPYLAAFPTSGNGVLVTELPSEAVAPQGGEEQPKGRRAEMKDTGANELAVGTGKTESFAERSATSYLQMLYRVATGDLSPDAVKEMFDVGELSMPSLDKTK